MQTIETNEWTQIADLNSAKTYLFTAFSDVNVMQLPCSVNGKYTIPIMWAQQETSPAESDIANADYKLKAKGEQNIFVKCSQVPVYITIQEVI